MDATLTKTEYQQLRKRLTFDARLGPTAMILLADIGLLGLAFSLVSLGTFPYVVAQLLFVIVFFHNFAIVHECGHGNCSKDERVNTALGSFASLFCFMPYFPWKYIHAEHHTWAGNVERDPTLALIRNYEKSQKAKNWIIRVAWRTWLPLLAFMQHIVFWSYPWVRFCEGKLRGRRAFNAAFSVLLLVGAYGAAYVCLPAYFNLKTFGPALVTYLVVVELINFPHHMGTKLFGTTEEDKRLPLWEQDEVTRSCYYPRGFSDLLFLNFNFHIEHHLFPDLPWYNLRGARELAVRALGDRYQESHGISWNLENRSRDATEVFLKDARDGAAHRGLDGVRIEADTTDGHDVDIHESAIGR